MMIGLAVLLMVLSLVASIWALVIIFKRTVIGGLLSLFLGLPMLYFLVTGWGKEGQDIRKPFFLSIVLWGAAAGIVFSIAGGAALDLQRQMQEQMSAPPARSAPSFQEPPRAAENIRVTNTPAPVPVAAPPMPTLPPQRAEAPRPVKEAPRPKAAQGGCVYKPVMTDEDMAKCR